MSILSTKDGTRIYYKDWGKGGREQSALIPAHEGKGDETMATIIKPSEVPSDTSSTAAALWRFECPEINAKVAGTSACNLVRNEGTLVNQWYQGVSDEELEAAGIDDKLGLNTLGLTLMAPPPCC